MSNSGKTFEEAILEIAADHFDNNMINAYGCSEEKFIIEIFRSNSFNFNVKCKFLINIFKNLSNINFGNSHVNDESHKANPLILLCYEPLIKNRCEMVKFLVEKIGLDIDVVSENYTTPIMYAYQAQYF